MQKEGFQDIIENLSNFCQRFLNMLDFLDLISLCHPVVIRRAGLGRGALELRFSCS